MSSMWSSVNVSAVAADRKLCAILGAVAVSALVARKSGLRVVFHTMRSMGPTTLLVLLWSGPSAFIASSVKETDTWNAFPISLSVTRYVADVAPDIPVVVVSTTWAHWYVQPGLVTPSVSMMALVTASRVISGRMVLSVAPGLAWSTIPGVPVASPAAAPTGSAPWNIASATMMASMAAMASQTACLPPISPVAVCGLAGLPLFISFAWPLPLGARCPCRRAFLRAPGLLAGVPVFIVAPAVLLVGISPRPVEGRVAFSFVCVSARLRTGRPSFARPRGFRPY